MMIGFIRSFYLLAAITLGACYAPTVVAQQIVESNSVRGTYYVECYAPDGSLKWRDVSYNLVTTVGKNLALDTFLAGSSYTVTGPHIGLISNTSYSGVNAGDTMASHSGWLEAGDSNAPTYSPPRKTPTWGAAAAGVKAFTAATSFTITGSGTLRGAFLVYGSGASTTIDNTGGTLYSAGTFSSTHAVNAGDIVKVLYATSM